MGKPEFIQQKFTVSTAAVSEDGHRITTTEMREAIEREIKFVSNLAGFACIVEEVEG